MQYILELAIPARLWQRFDYLPPKEDISQVADWPVGIRVQVPFGKRILVGLLLNVKPTSERSLDKLKNAIRKLDHQPLLTPSIFSLCQWVSDYYHHPLGEVLIQCLPKILRGDSESPDLEIKTWQPDGPIETSAEQIILNTDQQNAVNIINQSSGFQTFLLDGITGSGKTEVYFHCISQVLQQGKQVLVLVPEISLTPQTVMRFQNRFNVPIVLLHSNLSDKKRMHAWLHARHGSAAIIIGTRSAIFTPLLNPGMIILDEEHDLSFKQQSKLRYSARDISVIRARLENIPVILGSATPSLESFYNVKTNKYIYLSLTQRAGRAKPPQIHVINLCNKRLLAGMSAELLGKMREHLNQGGQVLLFLNRRGYASVLMCHQCGWMAKCSRCDSRMVLHFHSDRLMCHHCGTSKKTPKSCQNCHYADLIHVGQGTEKIEQVISQELPNYTLVRIDRDSTQKRGSLEKLLEEVHEQKAQILIGTQMIAKGHHFPHLSLVAVVDADSGLFSIDFRAVERMAQLLVQVAGRAGRTQKVGEVIIQTHHPDHPLLQLLLKSGYQSFAKAVLVERQQSLLPPFAYLALLRAESNSRETTYEFLKQARVILESLPLKEGALKNMHLLGPISAPMEKCAGRYRGQLLIQSGKRSELQNALKLWVFELSRCKLSAKVRWSLDVDPQELT